MTKLLILKRINLDFKFIKNLQKLLLSKIDNNLIKVLYKNLLIKKKILIDFTNLSILDY